MSVREVIVSKKTVTLLFIMFSSIYYLITDKNTKIQHISLEYNNTVSQLLEKELLNIQDLLSHKTNDVRVLSADPYIVKRIINRKQYIDKNYAITWSELGFVDHNCFLVVSSITGVQRNPFPLNKDYCKKARMQPYILHLDPLTINHSNRKNIIPAAIGIIGQNGDYMGALVADLQLESVSNLIEIPEYISYKVIDVNNRTLIASDNVFSKFQSTKQFLQSPYEVTTSVNMWFVILEYCLIIIPTIIVFVIIYFIAGYVVQEVSEYLHNKQRGTFELITKRYKKQRTDIIKLLVSEFGIIQNLKLAKFEFTIYDAIPKIYIYRQQFIYIINYIITSILAPNTVNNLNVSFFIKDMENVPCIHIKIRNDSNNNISESPLISQETVKQIMAQYYNGEQSNIEIVPSSSNVEVKIYLSVRTS